MVEIIAESILKCTVPVSSGGSTPGVGAGWAVSRSRVLIPGYTGPLDSVVSGAVDILYDQSGQGRNLTATSAPARPVATTSGPNSRECCDFSPASPSIGHVLDTDAGDPISDLITASSGYVVVSIRPDAVSQDVGVAFGYLNANVLNFGGFAGAGGVLAIRAGGIFYAFNHDGARDCAASASGAVPIGGNPCVIEWRHEGGNIYQRVNGGGETSVASGNTADLSNVLKMGYGNQTGTFFNGKIFEAMIYAAVPTQAERDAIVHDMMLWVGA
ncbi:hypothetical protein JQ609_04250 [Bradyrhizobium sp. AUGA SZCCT0169]|uniref:hypothetical protein n=1 Tax=Bradyrhizobium sp. AUGA SZCCT0169 TaxID=2807663 RepID=UPI001BAB1249|nr:hypothetical protein [Bradyrhizobium sp. AUGA SZCCT0169]MBR1246140.1 hypothetical protein [Bradyrhizobium sp. AUGA SZCCT0169]